MLLSHKHKFIFIKTNKTAGTSIEIALSRFCGEMDVITPNDPADEEIRRHLGYPGPRNCYARFRDYRFRDIYKLLVRHKRKLRFYHHMPASKIKALVGPACWRNYFKFCFERNPFDRVISFYYWRTKKGPARTISEFINSGEILLLKKYGYRLYTIGDQIALDRICRFERMKEELNHIAASLGFDAQVALPRAKTVFRKDKRSYRDILTREDRKKIEKIFQKEIELFGYEF